ncbi:hypothetical protein G7046_g8120 [Stylonectria norvegica]|nr:hypothetical protein G7046_g8120 [Stylonectria norvegica]
MALIHFDQTANSLVDLCLDALAPFQASLTFELGRLHQPQAHSLFQQALHGFETVQVDHQHLALSSTRRNPHDAHAPAPTDKGSPAATGANRLFIDDSFSSIAIQSPWDAPILATVANTQASMDTKRKANGAASEETVGRSSKRRKIADFDLSKGETRESTTAYGRAFLEQIRRTADKSGRLVATYFEELLPREGNAAYYKRTRLPISLGTVEEKLDKGYFKNLAQLESYFKRMITNAKEFYPRSSSTFDDAERIRKALSNYMTKTNPAYSNRTYQAAPTPLPPEGSEEAEEEEDAEGEENEGDEEEDEEEADEDEVAENDEEPAENEEDEEDDGADEEEEDPPTSKKPSIILKRRGPTRPTRHSMSRARESPKVSAPPSRPDHEFENVPYKGLSFQQAQEKLVEEMLRHTEPEYEDVYFEPFVNLPPRSLKDYYKVISDPLSIKKLQKIVKGVHGRSGATGSSDLKTWNAFAEKSQLLWTNAYFYNEEGSDIYSLAQELEKFFHAQLKKAQAAVPEPSQPKIKLKVGQTTEGTSTPKKITIHVGGRGGSVDSPAPQAIRTVDTPTNGVPVVAAPRLATPVQATPIQLEKTRSVSASVPPPSPSGHGTKAEEALVVSPAGIPRPPSATSGPDTPGAVRLPIPTVQPVPVQHNPLANGYMEQKRLRGYGKGKPSPPGLMPLEQEAKQTGIDDALLSRVRIQSATTLPNQSPTLATVYPHPKEMQQSATVNLSATQSRLLIVPLLPDFLRERQYSLWTVVNKQPIKPSTNQMPGQHPQERVFEVLLHPGVNVIETHLIAAVPRSERIPGGPEVELEVFTICANVMRT